MEAFIKLHVPQHATVFSRQYVVVNTVDSIPAPTFAVSSTVLARFGNKPSVAFLREQDVDVPILSLRLEARPKIFRAGDIQFIRGWARFSSHRLCSGYSTELGGSPRALHVAWAWFRTRFDHGDGSVFDNGVGSAGGELVVSRFGLRSEV